MHIFQFKKKVNQCISIFSLLYNIFDADCFVNANNIQLLQNVSIKYRYFVFRIVCRCLSFAVDASRANVHSILAVPLPFQCCGINPFTALVCAKYLKVETPNQLPAMLQYYYRPAYLHQPCVLSCLHIVMAHKYSGSVSTLQCGVERVKAILCI